MPPWLKIGTVILTLGVAMPIWAASAIVSLAHGQAISPETLAVPIGLLAAAGVTGTGFVIDIRRKKDHEGDGPDAVD